MKKYLLRSGMVGLIVTAIILAVNELFTACSGYCPKLGAFTQDIIMVYGSILIGGTVLGIIIGWIVARIRKN